MKKLLFLLSYIFFNGLTVSVQAQRPINLPGAGSFGNIGSGGQAKIDDSTQMIYGPHTAKFFLEKDIFNNQKILYRTDTSYHWIHRYNYVQKSDYQLVDLGNLGTASRWVFFRPVQEIGAQLGYDAYSPYSYQTHEIQYIDTKSPYTNMYLVLGGLGQNIVRFDHSQNLNPRLNLGINAQRFTTNKQFGTSGQADPQNNLAQNWGFVFHGNYRSQNDKYTLLGHFNHLNHSVFEQGGVIPLDSLTAATSRQTAFFIDPNRPDILRKANSWERRNNWHIYQQYVMAQGFQAYHILEYKRTINRYTDDNLNDGRRFNFYPNTFYDPQRTWQEVKFRSVGNTFGLKGRYQGFNYRAHYRQRIWGMNGTYNDSDTTKSTYRLSRFENFVGLWLAYFLKDSTQRATAEFEYLLGRDFKLKGEIVSRWFSAGYYSVFSSPTILQLRYHSNHLRWDNNFRLVNSNNLYGQINLKVKRLAFSPRLDYHLINNFIYFDTAAVAKQYTSAFSVLRVSGQTSWNPGKWHFLVQPFVNLVSNDEVFRVPRFMVNFRGSFDFIYAKVLYLQVGGEIHYKSAYFADAYMPLTQQFHLQNRITTEGVVYSEVFLNARINRVRLFVKIANAVQGLANGFFNAGYFSTPFYPVVGRSIGFGVNWPLFD
ncbi:MAG: putative porin [Runella sp.]